MKLDASWLINSSLGKHVNIIKIKVTFTYKTVPNIQKPATPIPNELIPKINAFVKTKANKKFNTKMSGGKNSSVRQ